MSSYQFEIALRKFIAAFDGTNSISQADFQSRFDKVYHKNYTFQPKSENVRGEDGLLTTKKQAPLPRDEVYEVLSNTLASGTKMTLIHFRKIGLDCVDIKVRQVTPGQEESTLRVISTLSDSQSVVAREIDESPENNLFYTKGRNNPLPFGQMMGAKFENFAYKYKEFGTYGTNM
jgi:hypothetical protein